MSPAAASTVSRAPRPSSLADVLDLILDKGLVIDAYVRVSLVGIELLTVDARVVVASVDTYLHFAEAVNRLDLRPTETEGLQGMLGDEQRTGRGEAISDGGSRGGGRDRKDQREDENGRRTMVGRLAERGRWNAD